MCTREERRAPPMWAPCPTCERVSYAVPSLQFGWAFFSPHPPLALVFLERYCFERSLSPGEMRLLFKVASSPSTLVIMAGTRAETSPRLAHEAPISFFL